MWKQIKKRFATIETIEGSVWLGTGIALFLGAMVNMIPFVAIGMIVTGGYKILKK